MQALFLQEVGFRGILVPPGTSPFLRTMLLTLLNTFLLAFAPTQPLADQVVATPATAATTATAPSILFVFPSEGEELDPVLLVGTNFGDFPIPFFGFIPSVPIFTFNTPEIPFIGTISVMVTGVPPTFFHTTVDLTVVSSFQVSNAVDFRML